MHYQARGGDADCFALGVLAGVFVAVNLAAREGGWWFLRT